MNERKKRKGLKIAFIAGMNVLLLTVAYLGFLHYTEKYIDKRRATTLVYDINSLRRHHLLPDQSFNKYGLTFTINGAGMRGPQPSTRPDPETLRLFVLGGSAAFDHRVARSWPERLGELLSEHAARKVESFNAGIPGYTSRESMAFYHDAIRFFSPDIVLIYQGWNDAKYMVPFEHGVDANRFFYVRSWREKYQFLTAPQPFRNWEALKMMFREFMENTDVLREGACLSPLFRSFGGTAWAQAPATGIDPGLREKWAATPGMSFYRHNILAIVHAVKSDGALPVLVAQNTLAAPGLKEELRKKIAYKYVRLDHENLVAVNEAMVDVLKQVSRDENIPLIDLRQSFNGDPRYFYDHVHMTKLGSRTFAEALARTLVPFVQE